MQKKNKRDALLSEARIALMQLLLYAHNVEAVTGLNFYIAETTYFQRRVFFFISLQFMDYSLHSVRR